MCTQHETVSNLPNAVTHRTFQSASEKLQREKMWMRMFEKKYKYQEKKLKIQTKYEKLDKKLFEYKN